MSRRSALPALPLVLVFCCCALSVASARAQDGAERLSGAAWAALDHGERGMVDVVARDLFAEGGGDRSRYDALPTARKAALRTAALGRLGVRPEGLVRRWV